MFEHSELEMVRKEGNHRICLMHGVQNVSTSSISPEPDRGKANRLEAYRLDLVREQKMQKRHCRQDQWQS